MTMLLSVSINCRIGSLEKGGALERKQHDINCRIGSLESEKGREHASPRD